MKKTIDFTLIENRHIGNNYALMTFEAHEEVPDVIPGQFAQVRIDGSKTTFLRRPISICGADNLRITLLVRRAGDGTAALIATAVGATVNILLPLGRGWSVPTDGNTDKKLLLVGGGVGVAPLLMLGTRLKASGYTPEFLLGARSQADLLLIDKFEELGTVHITTDDGTAGTQGVVTAHKRMSQPSDMVYCCGPMPMMKAVARSAQRVGSDCEVSLENTMACGLGACLCCVEKTVKGNVCVCTNGPVFNINQLTWLD